MNRNTCEKSINFFLKLKLLQHCKNILVVWIGESCVVTLYQHHACDLKCLFFVHFTSNIGICSNVL